MGVTSGAGEDGKPLGGSGHRDVAVHGFLDARVREHGPDDRFGFRHDLLRGPVVDAQGGHPDPVDPDPRQQYMVPSKSAASHLAAICWSFEHGYPLHMPAPI